MQFEEWIGQGGFARVARVRYAGKTLVAKVPNDRESISLLRNEYAILQKLAPHPNIIVMHEWTLTEDGAPCMLLSDAGTELFHLVEDGIEEMRARNIFCQLVTAVNHIHLAKVCHFDIKLENIMVDSDDKVSLIDFGLARSFDDGMSQCNHFIGSVSYCAPEVLARQSYDAYKADAWSVGICIFAMLTGYFPYEQASRRDWRFKEFFMRTTCIMSALHARYGLDCRISMSVRKIVHKLLLEPNTRLTIVELQPRLLHDLQQTETVDDITVDAHTVDDITVDARTVDDITVDARTVDDHRVVVRTQCCWMRLCSNFFRG